MFEEVKTHHFYHILLFFFFFFFTGEAKSSTVLFFFRIVCMYVCVHAWVRVYVIKLGQCAREIMKGNEMKGKENNDFNNNEKLR